MHTIENKNAGERKKLIWAIALGLTAIVFLWWTFFGFGGGSKPSPTKTTVVARASPVPRSTDQEQRTTAGQIKGDLVNQLRPVYYRPSAPAVPEAKRNIFAYYEPPPPPPKQSVTPTATPTPTPPVLLAGVSPSNVYSRQSDFTLEVTGDKFTPALRVLIDGRELPTRYVSPQQLSANVPASM